VHHWSTKIKVIETAEVIIVAATAEEEVLASTSTKVKSDSIWTLKTASNGTL